MLRILIFYAIISLIACKQDADKLILVSKDSSKSYTTWILSLDASIKIREFYTIPTDSMNYFLNKCAGIIMTGGEDVNPELYGKPGYKDLCELPDNFRDSIEKVMILYAMNDKRPLLGICRGQQIINAVNGGTLIPDIPTNNPESTINHRSKRDSAHSIIVKDNSWLSNNQINEEFWVNSRHHQCVDKVAEGFKVSAVSADGIIESIEIIDNEQHSFLICVQWHPESLRDSLASVLGHKFIEALN